MARGPDSPALPTVCRAQWPSCHVASLLRFVPDLFPVLTALDNSGQHLKWCRSAPLVQLSSHSPKCTLSSKSPVVSLVRSCCEKFFQFFGSLAAPVFVQSLLCSCLPGSCSGHLALDDSLISVWRALLTFFLVGRVLLPTRYPLCSFSK